MSQHIQHPPSRKEYERSAGKSSPSSASTRHAFRATASCQPNHHHNLTCKPDHADLEEGKVITSTAGLRPRTFLRCIVPSLLRVKTIRIADDKLVQKRRKAWLTWEEKVRRDNRQNGRSIFQAGVIPGFRSSSTKPEPKTTTTVYEKRVGEQCQE